MKQSAIQTDDIIGYLKDLFQKYDSISIDYEGDQRYLVIDQLKGLLNWVNESFEQQKKLHYTIAVRSTYDILHDEEKVSEYIKEILFLYSKYKNFHIILVAGNRKYVEISNQKMHMKKRFQTWIQELQKQDLDKEIFIGADNIFKHTQSLLLTYDNTKAVLLKNTNLYQQKKQFSRRLQHRLGVYSLLIESNEKAVKLESVRSYLQRRGVDEKDYKSKILDFAIEHEDYYNDDIEQKYNFMFLFAIEK